ncbi:MAG: HDIG domain-containing protein [Candidatus Cloacimonadaceae bacterium]|nr:HDIG domain-containing protein [Candidatus Cloacimonadaceae bacterium]MDP3115036.1 HDIG domain-containing protein [Candidatus Cloacimonadaceae bacterium]
MRSKHIFISIITALCIVALYQIFAVGKFYFPEYHVRAGQVADFDLIAPFYFQIEKSEEQLQIEREAALASISKPYYLADQVLFDAYANLDALFGAAYKHEEDPVALMDNIRKAGFEISGESLSILKNAEQRDRIYTEIRETLKNIYSVGIHENSTSDTVLISSGETVRSERLSKFLRIDIARQNFIANFKDRTSKQFADEISGSLIKPNLIVNEEKLKDISQLRLSEITPREGEVLQNEIIIRKNARISENDITKIQSLMKAYRARDISKSPWKQLIQSMGMLVFVMIILLLANHYFVIQIAKEDIHDAGSLPINFGFVLLIMLATANNYFLGFSSILIPFALFGISAAILINLQFGVFYSICGMFLISSFINWEPFAPLVLIIATLSTMILLHRRNLFHEYFTVWFYLFVATAVSNIAISLYKSDPLLMTVRNVGYGTISSIISALGIIVVIKYYERKWNRATKQTLLELLDFNHPLLKKLANSAVGTYHHSLLVGNIAERAAEAIGANALLARVGSYYHDIGKIINSEIFSENNEDSSLQHQQWGPAESAKMIKNHVREGVTLANKYHIPQPVIDIIMQHHGTSKIRYFLDQAEKNQERFDPELYTYQGPRPQSKEAVLVMLADIVESTTNAKKNEPELSIIKVIDDSIHRLIREGELDEAPISIKELNLVKHSMIPALESIYRKRLDYPEEKIT